MSTEAAIALFEISHIPFTKYTILLILFGLNSFRNLKYWFVNFKGNKFTTNFDSLLVVQFSQCFACYSEICQSITSKLLVFVKPNFTNYLHILNDFRSSTLFLNYGTECRLIIALLNKANHVRIIFRFSLFRSLFWLFFFLLHRQHGLSTYRLFFLLFHGLHGIFTNRRCHGESP